VNPELRTSVDVSGSFAADLHEVLREAAGRGPLATDEMTGATVVLRQGDLEKLAHDHRLLGIGLTLFDMMGIADGPLRDWYRGLMFTTDGDYHRRIRSLVSRAFTPRSVETLRAAAAEMAAAAVASVQHGGDLVEAFSALATRLIWTTRRANDPGSDLVTALLAAEADGERLTHAETVNMIANLLVAGHDTAGSQIPCSTLVALQHHEQLTGVHEDAVRLASTTAETMRLEPSIPIIPRTAVAPIDLHNTTIPAGSMVFLCIAAARRDETSWREPDRFDPDRFTKSDTAKLLNFGAGTLYCLGTALAKIAVEESLRAVLGADPRLRLAEDPADIPWRQVLGRSPTRLLVRPN